MTTTEKRGTYGELVNIPNTVLSKLTKLLENVKNAAKIDEHGGWEFGVLASNYRKGMIHAINFDWYAYGEDYHSGEFLAIIQVREFYRKKSSRFAQIRKSYFLLGTNEDQTVFSHPVESRVIHAAIKKGKDPIYAVQSWIFGCEYSKVYRQGDICLIPVQKVAGDDLTKEKVIEGSHIIYGDRITENGNVYVVNPTLIHKPGTHPDVTAKGKFKVVIGKRAAYWSFAKPTLA